MYGGILKYDKTSKLFQLSQMFLVPISFVSVQFFFFSIDVSKIDFVDFFTFLPPLNTHTHTHTHTHTRSFFFFSLSLLNVPNGLFAFSLFSCRISSTLF